MHKLNWLFMKLKLRILEIDSLSQELGNEKLTDLSKKITKLHKEIEGILQDSIIRPIGPDDDVESDDDEIMGALQKDYFDDMIMDFKFELIKLNLSLKKLNALEKKFTKGLVKML